MSASTCESAAADALVPVVYEELKRIARHHLRGQGAATLCTTELVHEAFLKLARRRDVGWNGRGHFFGAASRAMRQVLVDFARRRTAAKRGGGWSRVTFGAEATALEMELDHILAVNAALDQLELRNQRLRQIVELRFFGGVPEEEIAQMLGVSSRTVERDWIKARMFLLRELEGAVVEAGPPEG